MKEYKLIAFDMDGTLLTSNSTISRGMHEALDRAADAGKKVIICTGRTCREMIDYDEKELKRVRYYVCENGALLYDTKEKAVIAAEYIPQELIRRILDAAGKEDAMVYLASNGQNRVNRADAERMEYFHAERYKDIILRSAVFHEDIIEEWKENPIPVGKMNLYSATEEIRDRLYEALKDLPVTMVWAEQTGIEIMAEGVSKAAGFLKMCELLSVPAEETIAVGDSDNDVEMLKAAGLGIAMANALPCAKEAASIEAPDNDHDGCAEIIEKYLLKTEE